MKSIKEVLKSYKSKVRDVKQIRFSGVSDLDVYNITKPYKLKRTNYILGRVEPRDLEENAKVMFFKRKKNSSYWVVDCDLPVLDLQDPFLTKIKGLFVLGGVQVKWRKDEKDLNYRMVFFKGKDIHNLQEFAVGPWGMKGVRLVELDKGIGVFTRPQGKKGGRGKIGFTIIDSLKDLNVQVLSSAKLIDNQFAKGEWGGVNDVVLLDDRNLGVLGHVARYSKDEKMRFYYPMAFRFDYKNRRSGFMKILVRRGEIPEGEAKKPGLYNVVYPGGIVRKNGKAVIYAGVGDAEAYKIIIDDPFED